MQSSHSYIRHQTTQTVTISASPSKIIVIQPIRTTTEQDEPEEQPHHSRSLKEHDASLGETMNIRVSNRSNKTNIIFQSGEEDYREQELQSSIRKMYTNMKAQQQQYRYSQNDDREIEIHYQNEEARSFSSEEESDYRKTGVRSHLTASQPVDLILQPILKDKMVRCIVKKVNHGLVSLSQTYELYLVEDRKLILTARKNKIGLRSILEIFVLEKDKEQKVGIIKSNYTRTEYKLIAEHIEKSLSKSEIFMASTFSSSIIKLNPLSTVDTQTMNLTEQKCYVSFQSNFFGINQQQISVIRPKKRIAKTERFSDLKTAWENCEYGRLDRFTSKNAEKNKQGQLVLDFKQANIVSSSKNMILESEYGQIGLTFAKRSQNLFMLNIMHPFTLMEGFFMALCSLDSKPLIR